jgi:hypothetical protein
MIFAQRQSMSAGSIGTGVRTVLGREPINLERPADVRFGADNGLMSGMAPCPKSAKTGSGGYKTCKEKAARRRLFNSNLMIVDQTAINAGFEFRRYAMKPTPVKPRIIIAHVEGSGTDDARVQTPALPNSTASPPPVTLPPSPEASGGRKHAEQVRIESVEDKVSISTITCQKFILPAASVPKKN